MRKYRIFNNALMKAIAHILIVVLLLPFACILIKAIAADSIGSFISNTLDEIPVISVLVTYFKSIGSVENLNGMNLFEFTINTITESMFSMYAVGLCVFIFKRIGELIGIKGVPILQTVAGVFISSFILNWTGENEIETVIADGVLLLIAFGLSFFVKGGLLRSFFWDACIGTGMATISAGTICAYCSVLILIMNGYFGSIGNSIAMAALSFIPACACLVIDYFMFSDKN